jgi:hypothetical protein
LRVISLSGLVFITGCVRESLEGVRHEYSYQWWAYCLVFLGCSVAVPVASMLKGSVPPVSWLKLALGPVVGICVAVVMFPHQVVVDNRGFAQYGGFGTSNEYVQFSNLTALRLTTKSSGGRRSRYKNHLSCEGNRGVVASFWLDNQVIKAALPQILKNGEAAGVKVFDERPRIMRPA